MIGDFGGGPGQDQVATALGRWAAAHRFDALVTTGDNVYPAGRPSDFAAQLTTPYQGLPDRPLWVTLGNHDEQSGHGADQLSYLGLPSLPYAKRLPDVELLFLDGNRPNAAQADWLDRRLSEPGPAARVVVFHQPAYSCSTHGSTASIDHAWVPTIERHHVTLVLSGHDHLYERFRSSGGVTYVVTGGGGRGLYPFHHPCRVAVKLEAHAVAYHFVAVEVTGHTVSLEAVGTDGTVLDQARLRARDGSSG